MNKNVFWPYFSRTLSEWQIMYARKLWKMWKNLYRKVSFISSSFWVIYKTGDHVFCLNCENRVSGNALREEIELLGQFCWNFTPFFACRLLPVTPNHLPELRKLYSDGKLLKTQKFMCWLFFHTREDLKDFFWIHKNVLKTVYMKLFFS